MSFGTELREARQEKNLSLHEVESAIKIRSKYLQALEEEDKSSLPGKAYAVGFLKTYAKYLNIYDDEPLISELKKLYFEDDVQDDVTNKATMESHTKISKNNNKHGMLIFFILAIIAVIFWYFTSHNKPNANQQNQVTQEPADQGTNIQKQNTPKPDTTTKPDMTKPDTTKPDLQDQAKTDQTPQLQLKINGKSWLSVNVDGKNLFEGIITNQTKSFSGKKITIKIGNAGAVQVIYNNQDMGYLGKQNQVITKTFTQ